MELVMAYSAICESDERWIDQYLHEIERMRTPFAMHFDRCGTTIKRRISSHRLCVGTTSLDKPFNEMHKQGVLDIIASQSDWGLLWDVDETWCKHAPTNIRKCCRMEFDYVMLGWVNLWGDAGHLRTDGPFRCLRQKLLNFRSGPWKFMSAIVNGPKLMRGKKPKEPATVDHTWDVMCLHHGLMTRELREMHKARWDAVYIHPECGGFNPYGIWNYALDEQTYPPTIEENTYL